MAISVSVQSRIDMHCTPITTAQRKKQRIRLTNGGQRASAASNDRRAWSFIRACAVAAKASAAHHHCNLRCVEEMPVAHAFLSLSEQILRRRRAAHRLCEHAVR